MYIHVYSCFSERGGSWLRFVKIIHKTPYAGVAYLQAIARLLANTPKMSDFGKVLTVSRLSCRYHLLAVS